MLGPTLLMLDRDSEALSGCAVCSRNALQRGDWSHCPGGVPSAEHVRCADGPQSDLTGLGRRVCMCVLGLKKGARQRDRSSAPINIHALARGHLRPVRANLGVVWVFA